MIFKRKDKSIDSDQDGLTDYEERNIYGTDPFDPDTDRDGVGDGREVFLGRNPLGPGALKDFFIPHEGNDYQPHALRPKRIAFYAVNTIVIKLIVVMAVSLFPLMAWLTPDILQEQSNKIINLTNSLRNQRGINELVESQMLNLAAQNKIQDMFVQQYFSHFSPNYKSLANWLTDVDYSYRVAGENLAMNFSGAEQVMTAWQKSGTHYSNIIDPDFTEIGTVMASGRYGEKSTTLVVQMFADPAYVPSGSLSEEVSQRVGAVQGKKIVAVDRRVESIVQGVKDVNYNVEDDFVDATPPTLDTLRSRIMISPLVDEGAYVVDVSAYASLDTVRAEVFFNDHSIVLEESDQVLGRWVGQEIIYLDEDELNKPIILANVHLEDESNNISQTDIDWSNIEPVQPSLAEQYFLLKNTSSKYLQRVFDVSSVYFQLLLLIAIVSSLLNILIAFKQQHLRILLPSLSLIGLLVLFVLY